MFSIVKEWKSFRIHLGVFHAWLLANAGEGYKGASADTVLTLWFDVEASEEIKLAIDAKWDALVEVEEEAKFQLDTNREAAVDAAKEALLTANFDSLIPAERKLILNMPLTDDDKDTLVTKFNI